MKPYAEIVFLLADPVLDVTAHRVSNGVKGHLVYIYSHKGVLSVFIISKKLFIFFPSVFHHGKNLYLT